MPQIAEVRGKTYRLEVCRILNDKNSCAGCAFNVQGHCTLGKVDEETCLGCLRHTDMVWKELPKSDAYACDNEVRGYGACRAWCGDRDMCLSTRA